MNQNIKEETTIIDKLFRDIHKHLVEYTKGYIKEIGLTMPSFFVLWHVTKYEPVNISYLHKKTYMANSTLTIIIDKLVKESLVKRYRSPEDRRMVLIELTDKGNDKLCEMLEIRQKFLEEALSNLDESAQQQLINLLKPILNNLEVLVEQEAEDKS